MTPTKKQATRESRSQSLLGIEGKEKDTYDLTLQHIIPNFREPN